MSEQDDQLRKVLGECGRLRDENRRLRDMLVAHGLKPDPPVVIQPTETSVDPSVVTQKDMEPPAGIEPATC